MYYGWRGVVGYVKPTQRPGTLEDFIKLMPDGVGVIPETVGIRMGSEQEFLKALEIAEQKVAALAQLGVDLVLIAGAPPTMVHGYSRDRAKADELSKKYGVPVLTATMAQMEAFQALGIKRIVGISYFKDDLNPTFAKFLRDGGLDVLCMKGYEVPFGEVQKIPPQEIYAFAKKAFLEADRPDGIYILGNGWRVLPIVRLLEQDLQTTVVASLPAQIWATLRRLHIREPIPGYGKLLADMPWDLP